MHLCNVLNTCKNEDDWVKMKALEWPQHLSHYKYMGIYRDAQGQLTPQSMIGSGWNSNSSEILWLSLLPTRMKEDPIKDKGARVATRLSPGSYLLPWKPEF